MLYKFIFSLVAIMLLVYIVVQLLEIEKKEINYKGSNY